MINGAPLAGWMAGNAVGSAKLGQGGICVFEADESDRSLLNYGYEAAVITNSSADHFSQEETDNLFNEFASRAELVLDARDPAFFEDIELGGQQFVYKSVVFDVPMPGRHNVVNAAVAARLCEEAGCDLQLLVGAMKEFRGVSRRLELVGTSKGVSVYDDYAHNTEKIRAAWQTLAGSYDSIAGIWRPHGYGPLRSMMDDLEQMFSSVLRTSDRLILLPVYDAGGTADRSINSDVLAERLTGRGKNVRFISNPDEACIQAIGSGVSAVVTLGARDPGLPGLARRIHASI